MKIISMAETVLRSSIRTPSILQQQQQQHLNNNPATSSPLSPTPSTTTQSSNTSGSTAVPTTPTSTSNRLQFIKQRKLDLEKVLNEKTILLQQLCRQEAQIVGIYPNGEYGNAIEQQQDSTSIASTTLRRKVGTGFKLPENLLNHKEDDVNKLLLGKQIQQQISEASLKLANDLTQTKSIRRTHLQNYEVTQQKINVINQNLTQLVKRHNYDAVVNAAYAQQLHQAAKKSGDGYHSNTANTITATTSVDELNNITCLAKYGGNGNSSHSLHINTSTDYQKAVKSINNNSQSSPMLAAMSSTGLLMERRNSMLSTNSQLQLAANAAAAAATAAGSMSPSKQRPRHDSYNADYVGKLSPSLSYHYHHMHYGGGVSGNSFSHNHYAEYPAGNAGKTGSDAIAMRRLHHPVEQTHFGAYSPGSGGALLVEGLVHDDYQPMDYYYPSPLPHVVDGSRPENKENFGGPLAPTAARYLVSPDTDNGSVSNDGTSMKVLQPQGLGGYWATLDNGERIWCSVDSRFSSLDRKVGGNLMGGPTQQQQQQQTSTKLRKQQPVAQSQLMPAIKTSTSLGNFEFFSSGTGGWPASDDITADAISLTSTSSDQKRLKEKQWLETALDGPTMRMKQHSVSPSPPPSVLHPPVGLTIPPLYHRDKKKLSSHSMHSPGRSTNYMYDKQPYPLPVDAIGAIPTATTTTPIHITTKQTVQPPLPPQHYPSEFYLNTGGYPDYHHHQHHGHMSPQLSPFVHGSPPPPLPPSSKQLQQRPQSPNRQHQMLRRTASSVSAISTNPPVVHNPALSPSSGSSATAAMSPTSGGGDIRIESPKNMTVIQQAKFQPYKEVSKPFEMSDFYKYSTKFRQKPDTATLGSSTTAKPTQQPKVYQTSSGGGQPIQL